MRKVETSTVINWPINDVPAIAACIAVGQVKAFFSRRPAWVVALLRKRDSNA